LALCRLQPSLLSQQPTAGYRVGASSVLCRLVLPAIAIVICERICSVEPVDEHSHSSHESTRASTRHKPRARSPRASCASHNMQHATCDMQRPTNDLAACSTFNMHAAVDDCSTLDTRHSTLDTRHSTLDTRHSTMQCNAMQCSPTLGSFERTRTMHFPTYSVLVARMGVSLFGHRQV
jgi:hypothetical protein